MISFKLCVFPSDYRLAGTKVAGRRELKALCESIGYPNVRNYDGSCTDWGNLVRTPIEEP